MDTKQIEYILKIAEENNITHAANKLFITQSALNQQLIKLERELGTPLFHRSRNNWRPTEAGEIYLRNAKEIVKLKQKTYQQISDLSSGNTGRLSVGFTPGRGIEIFSAAYKTFHQQYANVIIEPFETNVAELQEKIRQGDLDIAFVTLTEEEMTDDVYEIFFEEELFLVVPKILSDTLSICDLTDVKEEPFVLIHHSSTMRTIINRLFLESGISPQVLFETRDNNTILSMIQSNLCCGILPAYYIKNGPEGVSKISLPSRPSWQFAVTYKKGTHLSKPARCFIDSLKNSVL